MGRQSGNGETVPCAVAHHWGVFSAERGNIMEEFRTEGGPQQGLYDPRFEHDACGIGAVVNINGKRDHRIVEQALDIVEKLEHRAGKDADGKTGDGVGIMVQISDTFFRKVFRQYGWQPEEAGDFGIGMFFLDRKSVV